MCLTCNIAQVWNVNAHNGIVAVFNLQGSSWDRARRQYVVHDANPPSLSAVVRPHDVESFRSLHRHASNGSASIETPSDFACYSNQTQQLMRCSMDDGFPVKLAGGSVCSALL